MTAGIELLTDAFDRVRESVHAVLAGLRTDEVAVRINGEANSVGWLVWHLTRVQDDHLADAAGTAQVWQAADWYGRFGLPYTPDDTGFGHSGRQVAAFQGVSARDLKGYFDAVHEHTVGYVAGLGDRDLARIVDARWKPPVTLGVRLVSVISDDLQHAGQAAFVRGVLRRRD